MVCPIPFNDVFRLHRLADFPIDTSSDDRLKEITSLGQQWFETPIALVTFVQETEQMIRGAVGLDIQSMRRADSFCAHTILSDDVMIVEDATRDPRFADNPLVTGPPFIRFYAGAPLITDDGFRLGAFCVIGDTPRTGLSPKDCHYLKSLARLVMSTLRAPAERVTAATDISTPLAAAGRDFVTRSMAGDPDPYAMADEAMRHGPSARSSAAQAAKEEFLSLVSHELRTPLNAILGFSDILTREVFGPHSNEKYREYAEDIAESASHLSSLIETILFYADIENGDLTLNDRWMDPADVIHKAIALCRSAARDTRVGLQCGATPATRIHVDPALFTQALVNLVYNAIEAAPAGSVVVIGGVDLPDGTASIFVEDAGEGLPDAIAEDLATPFQRPDGRTTAQKPGLGLGLPLTKRLTALHGGSVDACTNTRQGTRMEIRLPAYRRTQTPMCVSA